jgi:radical SAM protein with 4Fe4S-binding SPASM domain
MKLSDIIKSKSHNYYKKLEIKDHNLLYLFLEITRKCNLSCLHCGSDCKSDVKSPELTGESWLKIIDYIADNYSKELCFVITGGEPLVHKDLLKITQHIKKKNRRWGMVTNGLIFNELIFSELIKNGLYSITFSLDGTKDSHNKLRNNSHSYDRVLNALDIIGNSSLRFKDVVTCVYPDNLHQLDEIAEILIEKNITSWRLFRIFPSGRAYNNPITQLTFKQTQELLNWIRINKKLYAKKGLTINLSCEGWLPYELDKKVRDEAFFCRSGINMASVLADGTITGCSNNRETFFQGNILKDDFSFVWENRFKDLRDRKWISETICNDCEHIKKCMGSSIHLWEMGEKAPKFCYVKNIKKAAE